MTHVIPFTRHHTSSWKIRAWVQWTVPQGISSSPQTKKQQCLNWKKLRPFTRNKHPPTTAWSPWTMRVINNSLNTQKRPCPTEENNLRQMRERVFIRAFWEFYFCHRRAATLETRMFTIGVNRSTWGHDPVFDVGFTSAWCYLSLAWKD